MVLTAENYYSQEANEEYMSVSQFKDFCGTYGKMPCEFTAMEKLKYNYDDVSSGRGNYINHQSCKSNRRYRGRDGR